MGLWVRGWGLGVGVLGKAPWYHGAGNLAVCQSYQNVGFIKLRFWSLRTLHSPRIICPRCQQCAQAVCQTNQNMIQPAGG